MRPTTEMQKLIGEVGRLQTKEGLDVLVQIKDVREVYGSLQVLVGGVSGDVNSIVIGEAWVARHRLGNIGPIGVES